MKIRTRNRIKNFQWKWTRNFKHINFLGLILFLVISFIFSISALVLLYEWFYFYWTFMCIVFYYLIINVTFFYWIWHNDIQLQFSNNKFNPLSIKNNYNYHKTIQEESFIRNKIWKDCFHWEYLRKSLIIFSLILIFTLMAHLVIFESSIIISPIIEFFTIYVPIITAFWINLYLLLKEKIEIFRPQNRFYFISRLSKKLEITILRNDLGGKDYYFQK